MNEFIEGFSIVSFNEKEGFIDGTGKEICEIKYDHVNNFHNHRAHVELNGRLLYINEQGEEIV